MNFSMTGSIVLVSALLPSKAWTMRRARRRQPLPPLLLRPGRRPPL